MITYPFFSPIVLTDRIFNDYGGQDYGSVPTQRQAAYLIAEKQATRYIGTLLTPSIVTGTYNYASQPRIVTDYGYVNSILSVNIISQNVFSCSCQITSSPGCAFVADDTFGYLDVQMLLPTATMVSYYNIPYPAFPPVLPFLANYNQPYQFQVAYQCGLQSGTVYQSDILLALTLAAQINVNLMVNQSALAGEADVGIDEFTAIGYRETRHKSSVKRTVFGSSAMANKIADLLSGAIRLARPALQL